MSVVSILYVEDNDDLREAVSLLLESEGREIVSCATGEAAMAEVEARTFDVLITDVSLPGMSGTELAQHLLSQRPDQRVVMCSGYGASKGVTALGPHVRWMTKPFDMEDMEKVLAELGRATA